MQTLHIYYWPIHSAPGAEFPQAAGKQLVTLPGRITRLKGHEGFIELIARLKRRGLTVHGLIVGGASTAKQRYLQKLRYRVRSMGLDIRPDRCR